MEIFLDDEHQVFFPGSVIYGEFCVQESVIDPDPSHKPSIRAIGYTVIWKQAIKKEIEEFSLFFEDKVVLNPETNNNLSLNNELRAGYFKIFKFHLVLPSNLPPSHEVPFGHTRYKVEAFYNSQTVIHNFSVNQWVGLEKRNDPVIKEQTFSTSFFDFCRTISIQIQLNRSYLPGETIYVGATIINNSWKDVIFSKISIIQTTKYWKTLHILPIKHVRIIAEEIRGQIRTGDEQIWNKQPFYIPATIPSINTFNNPFNFFEVKYKMKVYIRLNNSNKKIILKKNIFIGNWDKSTAVKNRNNSNTPCDVQHEITFQDCCLNKLENNEFIPKYMIYENSQE